VDECADEENASLCSSQGQACVDSSLASLQDWSCLCVSPGIGAGQLKAAPECKYPVGNECGDGANSAVCAAGRQGCNDPTTAEGDWQCTCLPPLVTLVPATGALAECTTKEDLEQTRACAAQAGADECGADDACKWDDAAGSCRFAARAASKGDEDDSSCTWCWSLYVLGALCCCCVLLAVVMLRRQTQDDDTMWAVEDGALAREMDAEDVDISRDPTDKSAAEFSSYKDSSMNVLGKSLLYDEESTSHAS